MQRFALLLAASLAAVPGWTPAQDLSNNIMEFNLFNDSSLAVVEFRRADYDNQWGENWLQDYLMPGNGWTMNSGEEYDDRCEIWTRIRLEDGSVYEPLVNYCGTGAIFVTDDEVRWE